MTLEAALIILLSYLWGGLPSTYLAGRYLKGIDIREYGSGNVGASNLTEQAGWRAGLLLGMFDCLAKGTLPVVVATLLDVDMSFRVSAGLAAIAGHNWSPYIGLTGGRGVATAIGVLLGFAMIWEILLMLVPSLVGRQIFRESALWTLISLLVLPGLAFVFGRPPELLVLCAVIVALLLAKRLTANWKSPIGRLPTVIMSRLIWDRDVPRKEAWTNRRPS